MHKMRPRLQQARCRQGAVRNKHWQLDWELTGVQRESKQCVGEQMMSAGDEVN